MFFGVVIDVVPEEKAKRARREARESSCQRLSVALSHERDELWVFALRLEEN